jgi:diguanylate cyclase (GGDEF)-like protein
VSSFKLKLFVYFLVMAVLPLATASWAISRLQSQTRAGAADARIRAELGAARAAYRQEAAAVSASAFHAARSASLGRALARNDRRALERFAARHPRLIVTDRSGVAIGARSAQGAVTDRITVLGRTGPIGSLQAIVPLDAQFVRRLAVRAGIPRNDRIAVVKDGRVIAADGPFDHLRTLRGPIRGARSTALAVGTPKAPLAAAMSAQTKRLLLGLLVALALVALVAYLEGRTIVRAIRSLAIAAEEIADGRLEQRVDVRGRDELAMLGRTFNTMARQLSLRLDELRAERERLREVLSGFGAALSATHDVDELLRAIVDTAIEATGASGGTFLGDDGTFVERGKCDGNEAKIELPLEGSDTCFGVLTLVGEGFGEQEVEMASSLAAQAVVALDNARLHAIVSQQAMTDALTGLANRRRSEEALTVEVARVRRFGGAFSFVLADLDGFKRLNDTYGHAAGDTVLREFARLLRASARASDLAGRWGGEEFVLLLPETSLAGARELAERIRGALEAKTTLAADGTRLRVTASFGISTFSEADSDPDVVAVADAALYAAKRGGKNRVATVPAALVTG